MRTACAGRAVTLLVTAFLALGHGFAGAATHTPHHPDGALLSVAEPPVRTADGPWCGAAANGGTPHDGTSCEATVEGNSARHALPDGAGHVPATPRPAGASCSYAAHARSPPEPTPITLSVLRI